MNTLFDIISFDNKPYDKLSQAKKKTLEVFIEKIKENGLEETILSLKDRTYGITEQPLGSEYRFIFENNLPKDLKDKIDKIWITLND